jgi:predicted flap endonuclease-1-like 5' DNA nuclease/pimeloyl-ACP methyl ester carboxylesterase
MLHTDLGIAERIERLRTFWSGHSANTQRVMELARAHATRIRTEHTAEFTKRGERMRELASSMPDQSALAAAFQAYLVDSAQRSVLFLDTLRQRGNTFLEHEAAGMPPVLDFAYEMVVDGRSLPRAVNYSLVRILPPAGITVDDAKRPFMIIDPRAGHGAGIGGFKADSQVGEAFEDGHPVYFVIFRPIPEEGQTLADVRDAEKAFLAEIIRRHPRSPRPVVIGNCQGGWASMMLAASAPDMTGPVAINGAPMSYWAGTQGKNPMRYSGGLLGGAVPALLIADLGNGVFDGSTLVANFENMNPANTHWRKYYNLYANIDREGPRFLEFERWWGGFFLMNEQEIRWIVENLFIGNKLARGEARLGNELLDLRKIKSPIIVFASHGDNITPPQQALNWIPDLYRDVSEIKARGQRIVYMVHDNIGHLGIFVSAKIAGREHDAITDTMRAIEALPPGLYELKLDDQADRVHITFEPRTIDDILALDDGRDDEELFAAVSRLSQLGSELYDLTMRPFIRSMVTPTTAKLFFEAQPLRSQRRAISDKNPAMRPVAALAERVKAERQPVEPTNPFVQLERIVSDNIEQSLNLYRDMRDAMYELTFNAIYGSPFMRMIGERSLVETRVSATETLRTLPEVQKALRKLEEGGLVEGVARMLALLAQARGYVRRSRLERTTEMFAAEAPFSELNTDERAELLHVQSLIVDFEPEKAIATLPDLLKDPDDAARALELVMGIAGPEETMHPNALKMYREFDLMLRADRPAHAAKAPVKSAAKLVVTEPTLRIAEPAGIAEAGPVVDPESVEKPAMVDVPDRSSWLLESVERFEDASVIAQAPRQLSAPTGGMPDDLTRIKGIGPKLSQSLAALGIHHLWQVASWTPSEIAWINRKIEFPGRVQRERWVQQARTLLEPSAR